MNYAIITAGGVGSRMGLSIPKQLFKVKEKPLIVYTLEKFEKCTAIDYICLVFLEEYKEDFIKIIDQYSLKKIKWFVPGGDTNQMSIYNGLKCLKSANISDDDIILVHDGIRPLIDDSIIVDAINVCKEKGNSVAVVPCNEAMLQSSTGISSSVSIDRRTVWKTQTPHCMPFINMIELVEESISKGIRNSVAICTMLIENGRTVYFSKGSNLNFKLTTPEDIDLFKGILEMNK